ncbi:uncharacterized protein G2W53_034197 [Senna tora]|uniref:Uncharacterized protein n=1 Tax=Senna tora TaxID=362788 RepID=A0A834T0W2_9FABA|nr:uncharacterized protein G2W53_034197 [Senna tora]
MAFGITEGMIDNSMIEDLDSTFYI